MEQGTGLLKRELLALKIWRRSPIGRRRRTQNSYSVDSNSTGATICRYRTKVSTSVFQTEDVGSIPTTCSKGSLALSRKETI